MTFTLVVIDFYVIYEMINTSTRRDYEHKRFVSIKKKCSDRLKFHHIAKIIL